MNGDEDKEMKRELLAACAMVGILAGGGYDGLPGALVSKAIACADELIRRLGAEPQ